MLTASRKNPHHNRRAGACFVSLGISGHSPAVFNKRTLLVPLSCGPEFDDFLAVRGLPKGTRECSFFVHLELLY
jgi:hypothetical protein